MHAIEPSEINSQAITCFCHFNRWPSYRPEIKLEALLNDWIVQVGGIAEGGRSLAPLLTVQLVKQVDLAKTASSMGAATVGQLSLLACPSLLHYSPGTLGLGWASQGPQARLRP